MSIDLCKLPSLVTETILHHAVLQNYHKPHEWKHSLRLLKVCREWRKAAKRLVYSNTFIVDTSDYMSHSSKVLELDDTPLQTNIDLLFHTSNSRLARKLELLINPTRDNFTVLLDLIHQLLNLDNFDHWRNIRSLSFCCFFDTDNANNSGVIQQELIRLSNHIINGMPRVTKLYLRKNSNDTVTAIAFNQLAKRYSENLGYLYSNSMLALPLNCSFDSLTHLQLSLGNQYNTVSLPNVTVERIKHLTLFDVPGNFMWNVLARKPSAVFSNLQSLNMVLDLHEILTGGAAEYQLSVENPPLSVSFPKLEVLNVTGDNLANPGIIIQRYSKRLRQVNLQLSSQALFMLSRWGFESIDEMSVKVYALTEDEDMFYMATNYFFGSDIISGKGSLSLGSFSYALDPARIEWCNMTSIAFSGTILCSSLTRIIAQIPNLQSVVVWSLDTSDSGAPMSNIADCQDFPTLSNSLRCLIILDYSSLADKNQICQNILMLVFQLPRLSKLTTSKFVVSAIKDYGAKHEEMQHLSRIEFISSNFKV